MIIINLRITIINSSFGFEYCFSVVVIKAILDLSIVWGRAQCILPHQMTAGKGVLLHLRASAF